MIRFNVKSLLFLTTLVAAYVTMAAQAEKGPTLAGVAAVVLYCGLMTWALFGPRKDQTRPEEATEGAREAEENRPAS